MDKFKPYLTLARVTKLIHVDAEQPDPLQQINKTFDPPPHCRRKYITQRVRHPRSYRITTDDDEEPAGQ